MFNPGMRVEGAILHPNERVPKTHRYRLTNLGLQTALFYTRVYSRILRPGLALVSPQAPAASPASITSNRRIHYTGVSQNCWRLMKQDVSTPHCTTLVLLALRALHLVHAGRIQGPNQLTKFAFGCEFSADLCTLNKLLQSGETPYCRTLMLYYRKTKCLEWSGALALVGYRFGYDLRLIEIAAHAFKCHGDTLGCAHMVEQRRARRGDFI
ncbi:hypothetical protein [Cupriavidus sp. amp6]|uniref:hypothetical protein n=1 Tax=Cupriavidus sp. amp6 TaxID=388051 RepID=UPI001E6224AE|nr:hypothetical protein [Cupriavidus sp. amp6]